ncbi:MAG: ankyrin repeat domain-containing protein [Planctomycetaceae bacterium]|jgi:ankyrin repeat protein|nr:ankyrin repeat domain-containing protein [Planctomycetaceae bacterium]
MKNTNRLFFDKITIRLAVLFLLFAACVGINFADEYDYAGRYSDYIRLTRQNDDVLPVSLDIAVVSFIGKESGIHVDLIGAVHFADREYYETLNKKFKDYDAVLYELVLDKSHKDVNNNVDKRIFERMPQDTLSRLQAGISKFLDVSLQISSIDYKAKNMIHADLSMQDFLRQISHRNDIFDVFTDLLQEDSELDGIDDDEFLGRIIGTFFSSNPTLSLKRIFAEHVASESTWQILAKGESAIITDRNAAALTELKKQIKKGTKKIAIFYGCAHLPEFVKSLKKDFNLTETETYWIIAWDLTKKKTARESRTKNKEDNDINSLMKAARIGNLKTVKYFIEEKKTNVNAKNKDENTPLHIAVANNKHKIVKYLIKKNADVNAKNDIDITPLYNAYTDEHLEVAKCLIKKGANVNVKDRYHDTPLYCAISSGQMEVIACLVEAGADINAKNSGDWGSLHTAIAFTQRMDIVEYLVGKGADINAKDNGGETPLHIAVFYDNLEIIKYLIKKRADVNIKDNEGKTPLDYVEDAEIIKFLRDAGAKSANEIKP